LLTTDSLGKQRRWILPAIFEPGGDIELLLQNTSPTFAVWDTDQNALVGEHEGVETFNDRVFFNYSTSGNSSTLHCPGTPNTLTTTAYPIIIYMPRKIVPVAGM
jgi:hypothetical protein